MQASDLYLPVIQGTVRKGSMSQHAARVVFDRVAGRAGVASDLIDVREVPLPTDDAGESIKDAGFSGKMNRADGLILVTPEYNHSFPGMLKHLLDTCLKEYIHKPCGIVGVSAGPWGGTRVVENFLPPLRELGLATIFWNVNFTNASKTFGKDGSLQDPAFLPRIDKFLAELEWMAKVLRYGRENVPTNA